MKNFTQIILMCIVLCCGLNETRAQWVTIPDSNFVTWLNNHGFANCLNGNQMDTTCSNVVNATSLYCSFNISDLTGVRYFDHLTTLWCPSNLLTSLPDLPPLLRELNCGGNQLTSLPIFPASLEMLACHYNPITSLPVLPSSLRQLYCQYNQLSSLPVLPSSLIVLYCYNNQLSSLPVLPDSLYNLQCSNNPLTLLPTLPATIGDLACINNQLTSLPALPDTMYNLYINDNPDLICLPVIHRIKGDFYWGNTGITCLPNVIAPGHHVPILSGVPICSSLSSPTPISIIGGNGKICPDDTRTYSIPPNPIFTYTWSVPTGGVINSGQGTSVINVTYDSSFTSSGIISIVKVASCGVSPPRNLTVQRNTLVTPSTITGLNYGLCGTGNKIYSVTNVPGMNYQWTIPSAAQIVNGQGTNSITVKFRSVNFSGTLSVRAVNACGVSNARNLTVRSVPATPVTITGPATACANQQGVGYGTAAVPGATSYNWTVPPGAMITSGQGTNAITMNFGSTGGNVRVRAQNSCGAGSYRTKAVTINCRESDAELDDWDVVVYPNPGKTYFTINIPNSIESNYSLVIRDVVGRVIYEQRTILNNRLDFGEELKSGIYFAEIKHGNELKTIRLIKIK